MDLIRIPKPRPILKVIFYKYTIEDSFKAVLKFSDSGAALDFYLLVWGRLVGLERVRLAQKKRLLLQSRVGLESVEAATNVAKADRMAAEASVAVASSPTTAIARTEPIKPGTSLSAEQANIGTAKKTSEKAGRISLKSTELATEVEQALFYKAWDNLLNKIDSFPSK
ncbi:hypothetical protein [Zymobacter sp. IVIA_12111.31 C1]|uniref:hypothetical protein n=1 Tax=Zymobacter sp. IVIA_12111.31 C1 TaxID=3394854 RepID=UPI0039C4441B